MKQFLIVTIALIALGLGTTATVHAKASDSNWPVTKFVSEKSVLAKYYQEFAQRSPVNSPSDQMHLFCDLLMSSDLLADRLSQLGGKPSEMHAILMELGALEFDRPSKFSKDERKHIRTVQLTKDQMEHRVLVKVPYCEPFSSVHLRWEVDDMGDPAAATVGLLPFGENLAINEMLSKSGECLTWLDGSCAITLVARSSGTGRASVRIYLLDWYLEGMSAAEKRTFQRSLNLAENK